MPVCQNCGMEIPVGAKACPNCDPNYSPVLLPPAPGQWGPATRTSGLAIASLVLGILGICSYGTLGILGVIFGIAAISQINKSGGLLTGKGLAIGGISVGGASLLLLLLLVAIAIPNFLKFQSKAKQSEAKLNLGSVYGNQIAYFGEYNKYSETFDDLNWTPEGTTRYSYFVGDDVIQATIGGPYSMPSMAESFVNDDGFQIVAVGNIDNDDTLDVWIMNDSKNLTNIIDDVSY